MTHSYVIGLGKSGIAAARLLKRQGEQVTLSDRQHTPALQSQIDQLRQEGIQVKLGDSFDPTLLSPTERPDRIIVSPGVPWDIPGLLKAREIGIPTLGETELAWQHLHTHPWVGITGTNGKTTTTALIAAIFQTAGLQAPACGNIGLAVCELALADTSQLDWVIAELSSYQIESSASIAPKIGLWTTFTPDHLSRHKTLENYFSIKAHLLNQSEFPIFNGDDPYLAQHGRQRWPHACWTSVQGQQMEDGSSAQVWIENNQVMAWGEAIVPVDALKMMGAHNRQNLLMAVAAARLAGIEKDAIGEAITTFPGVPHRLEWICTWQGIQFLNDSKATNYDAAEVALAAMTEPVILIAGGEAKAGDDRAWLAKIQEKAAAVLLIGSATDAFAQRLRETGYDRYEAVETMDRAVARAAHLAQQQGIGRVLLSPACASFDQYQNFEQRGDHFRQLALALGT